MSAESINYSRAIEREVLEGLAWIATPDVDLELQPPKHGPLLTEIPAELLSDGAGARKIGLTSTLIKEKFQIVGLNVTADERDSQRSVSREASVRLLFKSFGILPKDGSSDDAFSQLYRSAEAQTESIDRSRLADLAEIHENHPAIKVFDTLTHTSSLKSDDIVFMKRTSLILIDEHTG